jgi:serine/threonine protein kinase
VPEIGDIIGGKYRVLRAIGSGGMGVVFEALHLGTDKHVAIKCLHPDIASVAEAAERLKREARATGRINHPNVVAVHDCGEHGAQLYLVMELLRGRSLRVAMAARTYTPEALCDVLFPALRGVSAAHAAGVLHRDLKPENVFLVDSPDGFGPLPKVLDFGLARFRDRRNHVTLSAAGSLMGTYQYMAPEQLRGHAELDERVDVYALGAIAYEMLTGSLPYQADNPVDLALQILESEAPLATTHAPGLPRGLALVIARALARERDRRFPSVDDLAGALEGFAAGAVFRGAARAPQPAHAASSAKSPDGTRDSAAQRAASSSASSRLLAPSSSRVLAPSSSAAGASSSSAPLASSSSAPLASSSSAPLAPSSGTASAPSRSAGSEPLGTPFHPAQTTLDRPRQKRWWLAGLAAVVGLGAATCALASLDRYDSVGRTKVTVVRATAHDASAPTSTGASLPSAPRAANAAEPLRSEANPDWAAVEPSEAPASDWPATSSKVQEPRAAEQAAARADDGPPPARAAASAREAPQKRARVAREPRALEPASSKSPAPLPARSEAKHGRAGRPSSALKLQDF